LPRIIEASAVSADVADNSRVSDYLRPLTVIAVVVNLFVFCALDVPQLFDPAAVEFAPAFIAQLSTV
jgi:hypothetical protein